MFWVAASGLLMAAVLPSAGGAQGAAQSAPQPAALDWRRVATDNDRARIRDWRSAFLKGLAAATAAGDADAVAREGALLVPDAALPDATLPAGAYRCRMIKLGVKAQSETGLVSYPPVDCVVDQEGEVASLRETGGVQRPTGLLFTDADSRMVFLGTMMLSDERRAIDYGADPDRDMAGAVQRIGPHRWRLVLPHPRFESIVDVVELVPAD